MTRRRRRIPIVRSESDMALRGANGSKDRALLAARRLLADDFEQLLSGVGKRGLHRLERVRTPPVRPSSPILLVNGWISPARAGNYLAALDQHLARHLAPMSSPIPRSTITAMRRNYTEELPKTVRVLTAEVGRNRRSDAARKARLLGVTDLLASTALRHFGEVATGLRLAECHDMQVLLYRAGDYSGPHNDHHPETSATRCGYVDVHLSLPNPDVAHQWLVYEDQGHLSRIESVARLGALSVYLLPFWHYTTPLTAKPGHERSARRWVLIATYLIQ